MPITNRKIKTSHADIAVCETSGSGVPVLLIHGNSSCKEVFRGQLTSKMGDAYRMIAVDLPGHGASGDALDAERTYTMPGYAEAMVELLHELGIERVVVLGWSLGGHVALEMIPRFDGIVGVMIVATPPVGQGAEKVMAGFQPIPNADIVGKPELTPEETEMLLMANYGPSVDAELRTAIARADGRARAVMFRSLMTGTTSDQRAIVERSQVPVAVVNGGDDFLVNVGYVGEVGYRNLWDGHCYILRGTGHSPFLQAPEAFNAILERFLADMAKQAGKTRGSKTRIAAA